VKKIDKNEAITMKKMKGSLINMKKYRIAYDYLFLPNDSNNGIYHKNENIEDIAIYMVFKVIDKSTGEEVYFNHKDLTEQTLEYAKNKHCYLNNFYKCVIDENEIFKMSVLSG